MPPALAELTAQAQTLSSAGDLVAARQVLADVLDPADVTDPRQATADLARAAALHARILIALGDPHAARQWAGFAHAAEERLHGPHDQRTIAAAATHAAVLQRVGHHGQAAEVYEEVVRELTAIDGHDSPRVLAAEADLATAQHAAGRCTQARSRLASAWRLHRHRFGDAAPAGIKMLARLGAMERECGREAEAGEHLAMAQELCARYLPADHPLVRQVARLATTPPSGRHVCGRVTQSTGPRPPENQHPGGPVFAPQPTTPQQARTQQAPPQQAGPAQPRRTAPPQPVFEPFRPAPTPVAPPPTAPQPLTPPPANPQASPPRAEALSGPRPVDAPGQTPQRAETPTAPRPVDTPGQTPQRAETPTAPRPMDAPPTRQAPRVQASGPPGVTAVPPFPRRPMVPEAGVSRPPTPVPAPPDDPTGDDFPPDDLGQLPPDDRPTDPGRGPADNRPTDPGARPADNRATDPNGTLYQQPLYLADVHQAPGDLAGRHARADTPPPMPGRRPVDAGPDGRPQPVGTAPASTRAVPPNSELLPRRVRETERDHRRSRQPFIVAAVLVAGVAAASAVVLLTLPDADGSVGPTAPVTTPTTAAATSGPPAALSPSVTPSATGDPGAPTRLKLRDNRDSVSLTWVYPKGAEGPILISGGRQGQRARAFQQLPAGTDNYVVYGLNDTQNYCFTVAVAYSTDRIADSPRVCTAR